MSIFLSFVSCIPERKHCCCLTANQFFVDPRFQSHRPCAELLATPGMDEDVTAVETQAALLPTPLPLRVGGWNFSRASGDLRSSQTHLPKFPAGGTTLTLQHCSAQRLRSFFSGRWIPGQPTSGMCRHCTGPQGCTGRPRRSDRGGERGTEWSAVLNHAPPLFPVLIRPPTTLFPPIRLMGPSGFPYLLYELSQSFTWAFSRTLRAYKDIIKIPGGEKTDENQKNTR